ncbi:MAG: hypothetical protein JWN04_5566 [Myxococcaceae bacterium]|nr:hypothetical protein [Myxococcaceae bacterium]
MAGTCSTGDVAKLAADVIANPPPLIAAAQRFLRHVGGQHEGMAAVAFLSPLARILEEGRKSNSAES